MIDPRYLPAAIAGQLTAAGIAVEAMAGVVAGPQVLTTAVRPEARRMPQALRLGSQIMASLDATGQARAWQRGAWMVIEVPRPDPRVVPLSAVACPPGQIALGMTAAGGSLAWNPAHPLTAHVLLAAQNGAGKSCGLEVIGLGAQALPGAQLALIDLKPGGGTWDRLAGAAAVAHPVATDPRVAGQILAWAVGQIGQSRPGDLFVLIDEVDELEPAGRAALQTIVKQGRASGVHAVVATQYPVSGALAKHSKEQFGLRIVGRLADGQAAYVAGVKGADALSRPGDVLVSLAGRVTRCQLALPTDRDYLTVARGAAGALPLAALPEPEPIEEAMPMPTHPSQTPKPLTAETRAWLLSRLTIDGQLPGVHRLAKRLGVGNSTASRWLGEVRSTLGDLGGAASWFGPQAPPSGPSGPSDPSRRGVILDFRGGLTPRKGSDHGPRTPQFAAAREAP